MDKVHGADADGGEADHCIVLFFLQLIVDENGFKLVPKIAFNCPAQCIGLEELKPSESHIVQHNDA